MEQKTQAIYLGSREDSEEMGESDAPGKGSALEKYAVDLNEKAHVRVKWIHLSGVVMSLNESCKFSVAVVRTTLCVLAMQELERLHWPKGWRQEL